MKETKFKQTEIGKIPEDWEMKKLKEIFQIFAGGDLSKISFSKKKSLEYKYPIYSNSLNERGLYGFSTNYQYVPECVTITGRGDVGKAECRKEPFNAIVRLLVLKPKDKISCYFVANFINSKLDFSHVGSAVNQLTAPMISDRLIAIPPISEQQFIASILSSLDAKIELNNKINKTLETIGQTIFKRWFIDNPEKEKWKEGKLGDFCSEITRGFTTEYVQKSNLINLNQKVNRGELLDKTNYKYYPEDTIVPENKFAKFRDILINSLGQGTLGRVHFFFEDVKNIVVDQHITIIRPREQLSSEYLYFYLTYPENQQRLEAQITGSTGMLMLNISKIRDFQINIPDEKVIRQFSEVAFNIYKLKAKNIKENEHLSQIRDALLPKLMSGEIRVPIK